MVEERYPDMYSLYPTMVSVSGLSWAQTTRFPNLGGRSECVGDGGNHEVGYNDNTIRLPKPGFYSNSRQLVTKTLTVVITVTKVKLSYQIIVHTSYISSACVGCS